MVDSLKALDPKRPIREADIAQCSQHVRFVPTTEARLFDHLVPTGEHLSAMIIRATRLAAILLHIARGLRPAKGPTRL
jgi:hypothetical protein